jgi:cell fate (sporulation/competence/biofilm development) regulator YlbF (YheA/YmcA/DUF963 family)
VRDSMGEKLDDLLEWAKENPEKFAQIWKEIKDKRKKLNEAEHMKILKGARRVSLPYETHEKIYKYMKKNNISNFSGTVNELVLLGLKSLDSEQK